MYKIQFAAFTFKCFSSLKVAVFLTECLYCTLHWQTKQSLDQILSVKKVEKQTIHLYFAESSLQEKINWGWLTSVILHSQNLNIETNGLAP